jgi:hypothetical protein
MMPYSKSTIVLVTTKISPTKITYAVISGVSTQLIASRKRKPVPVSISEATMSDIEVRVGQKRFFDNKKFPRGFGKSGDFTLVEADLLTTYGETLNSLQHGELEPENSE